MNAHSLMSTMNPWGTLDDMELINMSEEQADDLDTTEIWHGVEGHENFKDPMEAVEALAAIFAPLFAQSFAEEDMEKVKDSFGDKLDALERKFAVKLIPHALSIAIGDQIEVECGMRLSAHLEQYSKFMIRGAGLGHLFKAWLMHAGTRF